MNQDHGGEGCFYTDVTVYCTSDCICTGRLGAPRVVLFVVFLDTLSTPAAWIFHWGFRLERYVLPLSLTGGYFSRRDRERKHWIGPGSRIEEFVYTPHSRGVNGKDVLLHVTVLCLFHRMFHMEIEMSQEIFKVRLLIIGTIHPGKEAGFKPGVPLSLYP